MRALRLTAAIWVVLLPHCVAQDHAVRSHGMLDVAQTYSWSFDEGKVSVGKGAAKDIWFEAANASTRYLTPKGNALLAIAGGKSAGFVGCSAAQFSTNRISMDSLEKGTFLCAKSNQGRIGEFSYDDLYAANPANQRILTLRITYTTWQR
jgi:hypothetical protein